MHPSDEGSSEGHGAAYGGSRGNNQGIKKSGRDYSEKGARDDETG